MQYLLQDLIKLPLSERLYIIEKVISTVVSEEVKLQDLVSILEEKLSKKAV